MATLYKRGKIYWVAYKIRGIRYQVSTKLTDKSNATRLLRWYEDKERADKLAGTPFDRITLGQWKEKYLTLRAGIVSPGTIRKDKQALAGFLPDRNFSPLDSLTSEHLQVFYSEKIQATTVNTANSHLRHIKTFLESARKAGHLSDNPAKSFRASRPVKPVYKHMTHDQAARLIAYLRDQVSPAWAELVQVALFTGARAGEVCRLKASDVDLPGRRVTIQSTPDNPTKSKSGRVVPLPASALPLFEGLCRRAPSGPLLLNPSGSPWLVDWVAHAFPRYAEAALSERFKFHDLRRTYGAWLILAGADLVTVKDNLGHSSINVTVEHYAYLLLKYRAEQTDKFPDFLKAFE